MGKGDPDPGSARRAAILQASAEVFLRYGYRKTSMDDLARAASISRQGLYLHFPTKEAVFSAAVLHLMARGRVTMRAALDRDDVAIEERLLAGFVGLKSHDDGTAMAPEHMAELFTTAEALLGPVLAELDQALIVDVARALQAGGVVERWSDVGLTAKQLGQHLLAVSHGIKKSDTTPADYRDRMAVAIQVVCRTPRAAPRRARSKA